MGEEEKCGKLKHNASKSKSAICQQLSFRKITETAVDAELSFIKVELRNVRELWI